MSSIYVGSDWSTEAVTRSDEMFLGCTSLVGGQGTTYDPDHVDAAYAHIDGGTANPGYFTSKNAAMIGDVNGDGVISITDVTTLIDLLLSGGEAPAAADVNADDNVTIDDVTTLIDLLLE